MRTVGGAGLYTALAAAMQGAEVILYAPRPEPMPEIFKRVEAKLTWIGPHCAADEMPVLEIAHHGSGRATLLGASWGAEQFLVPACLPEVRDFEFDVVHIAALSSPARQLEFARYFAEVCGGYASGRSSSAGASAGASSAEARATGASANVKPVAGSKRIMSAGTYARAIGMDKNGVEDLFALCDVAFMNRNEGNLLFGDNEPVPASMLANKAGVFITDGENGATVYTPHAVAKVAAVAAKELDPTGAGDTFCGAVLAQMAAGVSPGEAASKAVKLASKVIEQPGPKFLL